MKNYMQIRIYCYSNVTGQCALLLDPSGTSLPADFMCLDDSVRPVDIASDLDLQRITGCDAAQVWQDLMVQGWHVIERSSAAVTHRKALAQYQRFA